jgi:hypothetical protein|tara:strand:+ start:8134 stop:8409 length:276 start_codon:yes stop_codon:yes gene_type:complete
MKLRYLAILLPLFIFVACEDKDEAKDERTCEEKSVAMIEASVAFENDDAGKTECNALVTALEDYLPCAPDGEEKDEMEATLASMKILCMFQ